MIINKRERIDLREKIKALRCEGSISIILNHTKMLDYLNQT